MNRERLNRDPVRIRGSSSGAAVGSSPWLPSSVTHSRKRSPGAWSRREIARDGLLAGGVDEGVVAVVARAHLVGAGDGLAGVGLDLLAHLGRLLRVLLRERGELVREF